MRTVKKQNKKLTLEVSLKLSESMNGRRQPPTYHESEYVFHIISIYITHKEYVQKNSCMQNLTELWVNSGF